MASLSRSSGEGASGEEGADALGAAFLQVAQKLLQEADRRTQEALRLKEQETEHRIQEALRQQEQRAAAALSEAVRQMEHKLHERDEAIRALRGEFSARMQRVEERMNEIDEQMVASEWCEGSEETGGQRALEQVDARMGNLEAAVQRALSTVFPRVEALVAQLEKSSSPEVPRGPPSTSTNLQPPAASALGATATGGAESGAQEKSVAGQQDTATDEVERAKQRAKLRIKEAKTRWERARAAPSSLGEELCEAAHGKRLDDVRRLLDSGAGVNYTDSNGNTPLISSFYNSFFAYEADADVVALLLERGADVHAVNARGKSVMYYAALCDVNGWCTAQLIAAGADVDTREVDGTTPLHTAAAYGNKVAVRALLAAGARKNLTCWSGGSKNKTPFNLARSKAIRKLLRP